MVVLPGALQGAFLLSKVRKIVIIQSHFRLGTYKVDLCKGDICLCNVFHSSIYVRTYRPLCTDRASKTRRTDHTSRVVRVTY